LLSTPSSTSSLAMAMLQSWISDFMPIFISNAYSAKYLA
jgi:hypothetical protein